MNQLAYAGYAARGREGPTHTHENVVAPTTTDGQGLGVASTVRENSCCGSGYETCDPGRYVATRNFDGLRVQDWAFENCA